MLKAIFIIEDKSYEDVYSSQTRKKIEKLLDISKGQFTREDIEEDPAILKDIDIIMGGWGMPVLSKDFLANALKLKAVFYAAGSVKNFVTDDFWDRDILLTSAHDANSIPVAEFTLAQIIFSLKQGWKHINHCKERKSFQALPLIGAYKSTVGLVSLGTIGKKVRDLLNVLDVKVLVYTASPSKERAERLNVEFCSLEKLFKESDVISLHTPWLKETEGMIDEKLLSLMKPYATIINTARGAVINEADLIHVLKNRPDLYAVLDVTYPEPPSHESELYTLPNSILTPHIAGSKNKECRRMGEAMYQELENYLSGQPLECQIQKEKYAVS